MKPINIFLSLCLEVILLFTSCEVSPQEVNYGNDHCHFCDMTIVEKKHVSQYVTKKGKSYVFDSIECMIRAIHHNNNEEDLVFILSANYLNYGEWIDVKKAVFLISEEIKSPMGENLSSFSSHTEAKKTQKKHLGKLYNWSQIKEVIK